MTMHRATGYPEMNSTKSSISFTITEFLRLVDYRDNGTHPGRGYGVYDYVKCAMCGYAWSAIVLMNTKGKECPNCKYYDENFMWIELVPYKGEGAMLNPIGQGYDIVTDN